MGLANAYHECIAETPLLKPRIEQENKFPKSRGDVLVSVAQPNLSNSQSTLPTDLRSSSPLIGQHEGNCALIGRADNRK